MIKKNKKLILFVAIAILIVLLNHLFGWYSYINNRENLYFLQDTLKENLSLEILIYIVLTVAGCVILALPGITFAILAGAMFGPFLGTICCSLATTIGAGASFIAGRFFLKESLKPVVMKNKYLKKWLFDEADRNDVFLLMLTRLVPIFPYNLQNFAYGITDISFAKYMLYSFLFMMPGTAMYTIGAAGIFDSDNRIIYIGLATVLAVIVISVGNIFKKRYCQTDIEEYPQKDKECISCGICKKNCEFLKKYDLDFSKEKELANLSQHCFLCGKCTEVCPEGIDGRAHMLELRRCQADASSTKVTGYGMIQLEKSNYLFQNYRHGQTKSVLFPGCNYPSFYPKTTKKLIEILKEQGIGVIFDCCGKPIAEMGLKEKEEAILLRLNAKLKENNIEEVIMVCPNCYYFLKDKLEVKVISIYEKLKEFGIGKRMLEKEIKLFLPCPDRNAKQWVNHMEVYLPEQIHYCNRIQCCGLGGCAASKEKEIVSGFMNQIREETEGKLYVYCGSCAGNFAQGEAGEVHHILNEILGSDEKPDVKHSLTNRIKTKFY